MTQNSSIRTRITVSFTAVIVLVSLFMFFYFPEQLSRQQREAMTDKSRTIATILAHNVSAAVFFRDTVVVAEIIGGTSRSQDVAFVSVRDAIGGLIASSSRTGKVNESADNLYVVSERIRHGGRTIGTLTIGLGLERLEGEISDLRLLATVHSLLIFFFGSLMVLGVSAAITRPLKHMVATVDRITQGDLSLRARIRGRDEVGQLALSFNTMVDSLVRTQGELRTLSEELEKRVKKRTAELEERNEMLREEIEQRQRVEVALLHSKAEAEEALRIKSEFLANMSHEIRTPMNGIIGMTELALRTRLSQQQRRYLDAVKSSADSLLVVINDVLDFSKIQAGRLVIEEAPFDVREAIGNTMRSMMVQAREKDLELMYHISPDVPSTVVGDMYRLNQVLTNLLANGVKFTEQGEVVVRVKKLSEEEGEVVLHFSVRDTGVGIPREKQESIFEAFTQVDLSTTRRHGGTGLGLTISANLVKLMGGRIWVESEFGQGSTFFFTVKMKRSGERVVRRRKGLEELEGLGVLVVDDNATNREILCEVLQHWGMSPTAVGNAQDALDVLSAASNGGSRFRVVLLDACMPGMGGMELARVIDSRYRLERPCKVMLSSALSRVEAGEGDTSGIDAWLEKPVKQSELLEAILASLGKQEQPEGEVCERLTLGGKRGRSLRILVAEDNKVNQELAVGILEMGNHEVVVAQNGAEAVEKYERERFDLILMDVQMPEMDGYAATAAIREREKSKGGHIPIVAMTAHAMRGDREKCLSAGMDSYISKPIRGEALLELVEQVAPQKGPPASPAVPHGVVGGRLPERDEAAAMVFDRDEALRQCLGNEDLLRRILKKFVEEIPTARKNLEQALALGDAGALAKAAHAFKGAAGNIVARRAFEVALALERAAKAGDLFGSAPLLESLKQEMVGLREALIVAILSGENNPTTRPQVSEA